MPKVPRSKLTLLSLGLVVLPSACATPTVITRNAGCSQLLPAEWLSGVPGADLPEGDTVGDWIAFADAQTGKLDVANGRTKDAISIVSRCEARDAAAVKRATRTFLGIRY
jgi:hypothetical protein